MVQQVRLGDAEIQLIDSPFRLMMVRVRTESDLVHCWVGAWGYIEAFIGLQGKFSLLPFRFRAAFRGVGIGIMAMPGPDELVAHRSPTTRSQERMIQFMHDGEYLMIRVAQHQHGGTSTILVGDLSITSLHSSINSRGELYTTWGDHVDLPSGFSKSLMEWGTSLAWQDGEWSRWSLMLDKMAWDPGIERFLHIRVMQRIGEI